jgi:hypothetical protein
MVRAMFPVPMMLILLMRCPVFTVLCILICMLNILDGQPERKLCIPNVTQLGYAGA